MPPCSHCLWYGRQPHLPASDDPSTAATLTGAEVLIDAAVGFTNYRSPLSGREAHVNAAGAVNQQEIGDSVETVVLAEQKLGVLGIGVGVGVRPKLTYK